MNAYAAWRKKQRRSLKDEPIARREARDPSAGSYAPPEGTTMANRALDRGRHRQGSGAILENTCVMGGLVYRGYEDEFDKKVNGYEKGDTISIRRPTDFTVRDGATAAAQDVQEGKFSLTVDKRKGVDFKFTSQELTLNIGELSERVIKPAMVQLGNQIDRDVHALYKDVWNWVGTPGQTSTRSPTSPRPRSVSISAPCRWTTALRFSRRPTNTACSARRLRSTCRTWPGRVS
jgi:hypothetical protein